MKATFWIQGSNRLKSCERSDRSVAVMAAANKTVWGIHTMDDPLFLNQNLIAIGWEEKIYRGLSGR